VTHDHEGHEERDLQEELDRAEGARAEPAAEGDRREKGEGGAGRGDGDRIDDVARVQAPDGAVVGERERPVARERGGDRRDERPEEDRAQDRERGRAERAPEQPLAGAYRTISSYASVIRS
jgi:hypothetical protein